MFPFEVIIRLGSETPGGGPGTVQINTVESVRNCSDKLRMKGLFKNHKVVSAEFWSLEEMKKVKNPTFPIIKKVRFHSRGKGMVFVENQKQLDGILKTAGNDTYFEQYFDGCREYRFHVSELGCFYTNRKVRKNDAKDRWYFNSSNCTWLLETNPNYQRPKTFDSIIKECQKGLKALGLDFAAFDVRVKKDGSFVILEANSAPSFGDNPKESLAAENYLKHLPLIINNKRKK